MPLQTLTKINTFYTDPKLYKFMYCVTRFFLTSIVFMSVLIRSTISAVAGLLAATQIRVIIEKKMFL